MDSELLDEVERAAAEGGMTVSAWLAQLARDRLALLGLGQLIDEWEAEHGAFTEEELVLAKYDLEHPIDPREHSARRGEAPS